MASPQEVRDELRKCGIEYVVWLPDSETRHMYDTLQADPHLKLVQVCREDEAIGVYLGLWVAGKEAVVLIQNTGMFNATDAIRATVLPLKMPVLLMVGYRTYHRMLKGTTADTAPVYTEPILKALGIPYYIMDINDDAGCISKAYQQAQATSGPVAVLMVGRE